MDNVARILTPSSNPGRTRKGTNTRIRLRGPMAFDLRLAREADAERLVKVINAAFRQAESHIIDHDRVDLESVRSLLARGEFLLAEQEADLAGCVYLERRAERAYLGLLSVAPERQNQGLGSMLVGAAEQR